MERTRTIILASLENDVFPALGSMPIADVTSAEIFKPRKVKHRGAPVRTRRADLPATARSL
jgi:hypothetical protein